jgi:opacity protein-like surface antigen
MASKKYKLLLGVITLMTTAAHAQTPAGSGSGYSIYDSSVISSKNMPQQNEFWNNTYNFPAKPRNMWEVGVGVGAVTVSGDIPVQFPTLGFSAHVRKAFGYIFSLRLQYVNGNAKGLQWQPAGNYKSNDPWVEAGYNPLNRNRETGRVEGLDNTRSAENVFYNYKTHVQDLSLQGIVTLNNVRFHKQKTGITLYGGAGIGATWFNAKVNATDANGDTYADGVFADLISQYGNNANGGFSRENRKDILKTLKAGMDNTYESEAESEAGTRHPKLGKNTLKPSGTVIVGVAYKLSKRVNIALEDRHTFVKTDLMDGQQWQEHAPGDPVMTRDYDSWNYLSLGVNFNLGGKSVEPLWWLNPLDYAYSELNNPKHMKLPKPVFDDTDGDGVTDQLDREPNTPAGCPVDSHGVTKDTDGDGVPDCKDKQLITPTDCQPVDADGVGKCPEPACCTDIKNKLASGELGGGSNADCPADYPSLTLKGVSLSADNKAMLSQVASKLKEKPTCSISLTAYPKADKRSQSLADKKLEAVKNYLVEKLGISEDRITTDKVIDGGDANTIDIKSN